MELIIDASQFNSPALITTNFLDEKLYTKVDITNSVFTGGNMITGCYGLTIIADSSQKKIKAAIINTNFTDNNCGGLEIHEIRNILIDKCFISNNTGTGITISKHSLSTLEESTNDTLEALTKISDSNFIKNKRALYLGLTLSQGTHYQNTVIQACLFRHTHFYSLVNNEVKAVVQIEGKSHTGTRNNNMVTIEHSIFEQNDGIYANCSTIYVKHMDNVSLENLTISDNNCTGITLVASKVTVKKRVDLTNNTGFQGGALQLLSERVSLTKPPKFSTLTMTPQSQLHMINNTAKNYGGGIFTDERCVSEYTADCFFHFRDIQNLSKIFSFSRNQAGLGGDAVFGGCLSNCSVQINSEDKTVDVTNDSNIFWEFASVECESVSTFAEYPNKVVFCNTPEGNCTNSMTVEAYRGESFNISLMVVDSSCTPSVGYIQAMAGPVGVKLAGKDEMCIKSEKTCSSYFFSITANESSNATVQFYFQREAAVIYPPVIYPPVINLPAMLTVQLNKCPVGLNLNTSTNECTCNDVLKHYNIECGAKTYSLKIPASTWIGKVDEIEVIQTNCQYCKKEIFEIIHSIESRPNQLCALNRNGTMCGRCIEGYSLQLSGNKCADCKNTLHNGILLSISFIAIGILLILLLLTLNLTVSTGILNALIFYCNIVYINSDEFLPITNTKSKALQDTVRFLSAFQAWMNLDFGIATCFLNNYDAYISTWSQFLYPIYIWLLILLIVCASRYSSKVSKLTASNIVPVLATLLLLSYAKLLTTSIQVFSFTKLIPINKSITSKFVWELDGNVGYLKGKHIPLFIMSCLMTLIYIVPFTLLVLLGPLLQAKSNYRLFSWINKLKPLMDAFYGPYNRNYRYWPGILLLARVVLFSAFAFYSLDNRHYKFITITTMVAALSILWSIFGLTSPASAYTNRYLSYLELLFLVNLGLFAFRSQTIRNDDSQQILAVIMTGSTFIIFSGIVMYQTACALFKLKVVRKWCQFIRTRKMVHLSNFIQTRKGKSEVSEVCQDQSEDGCTHSTVSVAECTQSMELREPLLTDQ